MHGFERPDLLPLLDPLDQSFDPSGKVLQRTCDDRAIIKVRFVRMVIEMGPIEMI